MLVLNESGVYIASDTRTVSATAAPRRNKTSAVLALRNVHAGLVEGVPGSRTVPRLLFSKIGRWITRQTL